MPQPVSEPGIVQAMEQRHRSSLRVMEVRSDNSKQRHILHPCILSAMTWQVADQATKYAITSTGNVLEPAVHAGDAQVSSEQLPAEPVCLPTIRHDPWPGDRCRPTRFCRREYCWTPLQPRDVPDLHSQPPERLGDGSDGSHAWGGSFVCPSSG